MFFVDFIITIMQTWKPDCFHWIRHWYNKKYQWSVHRCHQATKLEWMQINSTTDLLRTVLISPKLSSTWRTLKSILYKIIKWKKIFQDGRMMMKMLCLPKNVESKIGFLPYLSDQGPIRKLMNAGMILSKTARHINIFDAYFSTSAYSVTK